MRERWRNVRPAPGYRVSSYGHVKSLGGFLTPVADRDGYLRVTIRGEKVAVAHLVLEAFVGQRPYGTEACHDPLLSTGRDDCRLLALRWDTRLENARDKLRAESKITAEVVSSPVRPVASVTGDGHGC